MTGVDDKKQLILGYVGTGLVMLAILIMLAPERGFRFVLIGPAAVGIILMQRTGIQTRLRQQDSVRRSIADKSLRHLRILAWSRLLLMALLPIFALVVCARWIDGALGLSALQWWMIGGAGVMASVAAGLVLTLQEATEIARAADEPAPHSDG